MFVHHAGVSDGIKSAVEYALKESKITNVICTSTLAQGVNLPIKYLIISSIYQAGEQIKVRDFHNLIGRTARSGMFTEGTIIFSDPFAYNVDRWKWEQYKRLLDPNNSESYTASIIIKNVPVIDLKRIKELLSAYPLNAVFHILRNHEYEFPVPEGVFITHQEVEYAGYRFKIPAICCESSPI